jgi:hypothetical protein
MPRLRVLTKVCGGPNSACAGQRKEYPDHGAEPKAVGKKPRALEFIFGRDLDSERAFLQDTELLARELNELAIPDVERKEAGRYNGAQSSNRDTERSLMV